MSYYDVDWSDRFGFGRPRPLSGLIGVCIHTTENDAGTPAENVANYQITSESGSYNVLTDTSGKRLRENTDDWQVWATGNKGNDVLLHLSFVARAAWSREKWLSYPAMLRAGATVVAYWCKTYGFPVRHAVTVAQLPGVTTHNATRAWGGTDHTDPGPGFPMDVFLGYVTEAMNGGTEPAPLPHPREDAMNAEQAHQLSDVTGQLTGSPTPGEFPGWDQLGGRTPVDALAALCEKAGVPGCYDPKARQ